MVILESPLQVLPLRPRITPLMMCFFVFVVCVVSCTAFTPDSADIADDDFAVVAIVNGTIVSCCLLLLLLLMMLMQRCVGG